MSKTSIWRRTGANADHRPDDGAPRGAGVASADALKPHSIEQHYDRAVPRNLTYREPMRLATRMRQIGAGNLVREFPRRSVRKLVAYGGTPLAKRRLAGSTFQIGDRELPYFVHSYGSTWQTERMVEIPLALEFLDSMQGRSVLEVGNVTRHYSRPHHDVLDKYDDRPGVISRDIEGFTPSEPYEAVLSISTLEHVGWDETPREPDKVARVLTHLRTLVSDPAAVLVTMPIGYNERLDEIIRAATTPFAESRFLARRSEVEWLEVDRDEALRARYGSPFPCANAVFVGRGLLT